MILILNLFFAASRIIGSAAFLITLKTAVDATVAAVVTTATAPAVATREGSGKLISVPKTVSVGVFGLSAGISATGVWMGGI